MLNMSVRHIAVDDGNIRTQASRVRERARGGKRRKRYRGAEEEAKEEVEEEAKGEAEEEAKEEAEGGGGKG